MTGKAELISEKSQFVYDIGEFTIGFVGTEIEDREQFAQLIGYSVSGAGDLSYFSNAVINIADEKVEELIANKAP